MWASRSSVDLPIIRSVYSSVKQITDFIFTEQDLAFTRVVALEYPRKGIWSLAFVTGDGMYDIRKHCWRKGDQRIGSYQPHACHRLYHDREEERHD